MLASLLSVNAFLLSWRKWEWTSRKHLTPLIGKVRNYDARWQMASKSFFLLGLFGYTSFRCDMEYDIFTRVSFVSWVLKLVGFDSDLKKFRLSVTCEMIRRGVLGRNVVQIVVRRS